MAIENLLRDAGASTAYPAAKETMDVQALNRQWKTVPIQYRVGTLPMRKVGDRQ